MILQRKIDTLTKRELNVYLTATAPEGLTQPQGDREALKAALKARVRGEVVTLLDINTATIEMLTAAGLTKHTATALRDRRPILSWGELDDLPGLTAAQRRDLIPAFNIQAIKLPDGKTLKVAEQAPEIIAVSQDAETAAGGDIKYSLPHEIENAGDVHGRRLPAYEDENGALRYLDPRFVTAQMHKAVDDPAVAEVFAAAGVVVFRRFQTPGLVMLALAAGRHGTGALNTALTVLAASPLAEIVEPAWIAMDTIEEARSLRKAARKKARTPQHDVTPGGAQMPRQRHTEDIDFVDMEIEDVGAGVLPWNLALVNGDALGQGDPSVTVVVIDTGVDDTHPAIRDRIVPMAPGETRNYDAGPDVAPVDQDGHGTAVVSLLVGNGTSGVRGIAPGCSVVVLRVPMVGSLAAYALRRDALLAVANRASAGQRIVVNMSWRTDGDVALVRNAIERVHAAGALMVCSAGNGEPIENQPHYPSGYPATISVAAVTAARARAAYSYYGNTIDLSAPGGDTTQPIVCAAIGGGIIARFGTSFAAPHVAGTLALAWSAAPRLTAAQVRAAVESAATALPQSGLGRGLIDLARIAQTLIAALPQTPTPEAWLPETPREAPMPEIPRPAAPHSPGGNAATKARFPMPGAVLADTACAMPTITRRILRGRLTFDGWGEVGTVLGMSPAVLTCLRTQLTP